MGTVSGVYRYHFLCYTQIKPFYTQIQSFIMWLFFLYKLLHIIIVDVLGKDRLDDIIMH